MSVANLNAFALEKGMNKAFDKMSQAEQATLRYQYLLEATKDAQGDFARTGDSFSNEMRKLQTNLDRIKTEFGKGLLGVVTPAISLLNNVLSDKSYQQTAIEKIYSERDESLFDAEVAYQRSLTIVDSMRSIEDESGDAVKSTEEWRAALEALKDVMPGLSQYVDLTTDAIIGNDEAIQNYVDTLHGVTKYNSYDQAVSDAQKRYDDLQTQIAEKEADIAKRELLIQSSDELQKLYDKRVEDAWRTYAQRYGYEPDYQTARNMPASDVRSYAYATGTTANPHANLGGLVTGLNAEQIYYFDLFRNAQNAAKDPLAQEKAELESEKEELAELVPQAEEAAVALDDVKKSREEYVNSPEGRKAKLNSDFKDAVDAEKKALEDLKTALKDVETYRADTLKKAQEAYKGVASGMGYMVTHTRAEMDKLLATDYSKENVLSWYGTNADALHAYNDALQQAEAAGVDVGILSGLTTYSRDNDAYLSRLLNLTPEEIKQLNADYQRARDEENAMAETKTRYTLANDETYQAMLETVKKSLEAFEQKDAIAAYMAENNSAFLAGIDDMKQTLVKEIPQINALLKILGFNNKIETKIHEWTTDFSQNETPYDFLGDISTGKGRAANAPLAVGGHLMEYWAPNPETNPQELADVLAALEAKQKENQKVREGNGYWDKAQEAADKAYENRRQVAKNLTFIREMQTTFETMQENYLTALKERKAPNITNNEDGVLWVRIENPADVAKAVSGLPPTTIQNNFSVDGKMIATAIAPYVNSAIGGTIRSNLMFTKWGD